MTVSPAALCTMKLQFKVQTDSLHWRQPTSVGYFTLNSGMSVINRSHGDAWFNFSFRCALRDTSHFPSCIQLRGLSGTFQSM